MLYHECAFIMFIQSFQIKLLQVYVSVWKIMFLVIIIAALLHFDPMNKRISNNVKLYKSMILEFEISSPKDQNYAKRILWWSSRKYDLWKSIQGLALFSINWRLSMHELQVFDIGRIWDMWLTCSTYASERLTPIKQRPELEQDMMKMMQHDIDIYKL